MVFHVVMTMAAAGFVGTVAGGCGGGSGRNGARTGGGNGPRRAGVASK